MAPTLHAVEVDAVIDEHSRLVLPDPLPIRGPSRVRVIILIPDSEPTESEWLAAATCNPAFEFLMDPAEDVYSPTDGKPYSG